MAVDNEKIRSILEPLREKLPPIVFRTYPHFKEEVGYSPRYVANEDARGAGPKQRICVGRLVGYPRDALIDWLIERTKVFLSAEGEKEGGRGWCVSGCGSRPCTSGRVNDG